MGYQGDIKGISREYQGDIKLGYQVGIFLIHGIWMKFMMFFFFKIDTFECQAWLGKPPSSPLRSSKSPASHV